MMLVMLNQNSHGMYMVLLMSFLLFLKDESSLIAIVMGSLSAKILMSKTVLKLTPFRSKDLWRGLSILGLVSSGANKLWCSVISCMDCSFLAHVGESQGVPSHLLNGVEVHFGLSSCSFLNGLLSWMAFGWSVISLLMDCGNVILI